VRRDASRLTTTEGGERKGSAKGSGTGRSTHDNGQGGTMSKKSVHEILQDPDFKELYGKRMNIAWTLTVLELVLYFGFVALVSYNKPFLAQKMSGGTATTIGIPIAVGTIFLSWVFTGIYVRWANTTYDGLVQKVKDKIGG
jgi:uncharacterized membrane protein (DUF485 family)